MLVDTLFRFSQSFHGVAVQLSCTLQPHSGREKKLKKVSVCGDDSVFVAEEVFRKYTKKATPEKGCTTRKLVKIKCFRLLVQFSS